MFSVHLVTPVSRLQRAPATRQVRAGPGIGNCRSSMRYVNNADDGSREPLGISAAAPGAPSTSDGRDGPGVTEADRKYMAMALQLARRGEGYTHPNPVVGCVIVRGDEVVGEGYHPKAGMPHAEVYALRGAGPRAVGATAYVTLEPCNHYGRTPPCSQALVDAGVSRVVVGVGDPNPLVSGGGLTTLRAADVDVVVGCLEQECYDINREFMLRISQG